MQLFQCENLAFSYRSGRRVIDNLNLELESGKFHGFMGPNGCGKTTLIDLLGGHLKPRRGRLLLEGRPVTSFTRRELALKIALVPQFYNISFPYTAREIVMMGRYPHLPRFAAIGTEELALVEETMRATDTLALADRPITELSGGERQRVVFARALVQEAPILFLDEATANLDINHTLNLLSLVRRKVDRDGLTVVAVFQDMNLAAACCDRLVLLNRGRVEIAGSSREVLAPEPLARVFGIQAQVYADPFFNRRRVICRFPVEGR